MTGPQKDVTGRLAASIGAASAPEETAARNFTTSVASGTALGSDFGIPEGLVALTPSASAFSQTAKGVDVNALTGLILAPTAGHASLSKGKGKTEEQESTTLTL